MTPFEALHTLRRHDASMKVTLPLCSTCAEALLAELDGLFPPVPDGHTRTLAHMQVMGYTFAAGPIDECALHAYLDEEAPCP